MGSLEKLGIREQVAIIGIAKRLEEIYIPSDPVPLYLDKNSLSLRLIQQVRNEAHRFGISFHRRKREMSLLGSELDSVPGVGSVTKEKLLRKIKDLAQLTGMSIEEIAGITGLRAARNLYDHFHRNVKNS